jgi:RNA polymerase subunit RPABC4/transcription elongation factor Spt4
MAGATCPACGSTQLNALEGRTFACQNCGNHFDIGLCPACGSLVAEGLEACPTCGRALTLLPQVISRHTDPRVPQWLADVRGRAEAIKITSAAASDARMQVFDDIDRKRVAHNHEQAAQRRGADRVVLGLSLAVSAGILLLCLILVLVFRTP